MLLKISIIASIIAGILIAFQLFKKDSPVKNSNIILAWFVVFVAITLAGRFFYTFEPLTLLMVRILFIGDFLIFSFGPLLYLYLASLFGSKSPPKIKTWVHFIPLVAYFLFVIPLLFVSRESFFSYMRIFYTTFQGIELFAIVQNIFYLVLSFKIVHRFNKVSLERESYVPNLVLINTLLFITNVAIFIWGASFVVRTFFPDYSDDFLGYQVVWFALSFFILLLAYMVLIFPALFQFETTPPVIIPDVILKEKEDYTEYAKVIEETMRETKPYLQPRITLNDLSDLTGINRNLLSRIINEHYNKNFFDFINMYRIEEFKSIAESNRNENLTILALAYQAGFNSKTTFNTAFKKLTNKTPGEYYKNVVKTAI